MRNPFRGKGGRAMLVALTLFTIAGSFETLSEPSALRQGYLVSSLQSDQNGALTQASGEFRIVAANLLWSKVLDHYHHQYMADGGSWNKNENLLPLLKTIITLDPHFSEAYQIMGYSILPSLGREAEGKAILARGIKSNPNDWELYRDMAMLCAVQEKRPDTALPFAEAGLRCANDDFSKQLMSKLCVTLQGRVKNPSPVQSNVG